MFQTEIKMFKVPECDVRVSEEKKKPNQRRDSNTDKSESSSLYCQALIPRKILVASKRIQCEPAKKLENKSQQTYEK